MQSILVTERKEALTDFLDGLAAPERVEVRVVANGADAIDGVGRSAVGLVVIDEGLPDFDALSLVVALLRVDAQVNTAIISSLSEGAFHDQSEGYGVLRALPPHPNKQDGIALAEQAIRIVDNQ